VLPRHRDPTGGDGPPFGELEKVGCEQGFKLLARLVFLWERLNENARIIGVNAFGSDSESPRRIPRFINASFMGLSSAIPFQDRKGLGSPLGLLSAAAGVSRSRQRTGNPVQVS
jgi:hypothetical protein